MLKLCGQVVTTIGHNKQENTTMNKPVQRTAVATVLHKSVDFWKAQAEGMGITPECKTKYIEIQQMNNNTPDATKWLAKVSDGYKDPGYFIAHAQYFTVRTLREALDPNETSDHIENCMKKIHMNLMATNKTSCGGNKHQIRDDWKLFCKAENIDPYIFADASSYDKEMKKDNFCHGIKNDI